MPKTIQDIERIEKESYFFIVDLLAHEYSWTIEYIQKLTIPEISGLIRAIRTRMDIEDQTAQLNIAKGFSGKMSSNFQKKASKKQRMQEEIENLEQLSKMLKVPVQKVRKNG